jgi:hypothetical protein
MGFLELWHALNDFLAELMHLDMYEDENENKNEVDIEKI